jgi:hypothetical protein
VRFDLTSLVLFVDAGRKIDAVLVELRQTPREVSGRDDVADDHPSLVEAMNAAHAAGDVVTLTGHVGTWLQRDIAERAAAGAPGIRRVDNLITVEPPIEKEED